MTKEQIELARRVQTMALKEVLAPRCRTPQQWRDCAETILALEQAINGGINQFYNWGNVAGKDITVDGGEKE